MPRFQPFAACTLVWFLVASARGQEPAVPPASGSLFQETVARLANARLSSEQVTRIQTLAADFQPRIEREERTSLESEAQQRARSEAIAQAVKQGLRGARARALLQRVVTRTDEQRAAFQRAAQLRRAFDQAVIGVLTETQRAEIEQPQAAPNAQSGFLIVALSPGLPLPPRSAVTLDDAAVALDLPNLRAVITRYGLVQSQRAVDPALLDRLDDGRNAVAARETRRMRTFWQIDVRALKADDVDAAVQRLRGLAEIQHAYVALQLEEPSRGCSSANQSDEPYFRHQGYLNPSPLGIDAEAAWELAGGQGNGVGLVDLERGWNINHEDLKVFLRPPIHGNIKPGNDHGTSVLGQLVAEDNTVGVIGAVPCAEYVLLTSMYHAGSGSEPHIANAVSAALYFMDPGDVLLIEQETGTMHPVEVEPLNYSAIRLAVAQCMVVVEPAGNGRHDLDQFTYLGKKILNRHSSDFQDSGAILVGARPIHRTRTTKPGDPASVLEWIASDGATT